MGGYVPTVNPARNFSLNDPLHPKTRQRKPHPIDTAPDTLPANFLGWDDARAGASIWIQEGQGKAMNPLEDTYEDCEIVLKMRLELMRKESGETVTEQPGIVKEWTEHYEDGTSCDYVEYERDGKKVLRYRNYANPPESNASPLASASSFDTSVTSPLVNTDLDDTESPQ